MLRRPLFLAIILLFIAQFRISQACTNLIVTRGASAKSSVMITYSADSHIRYGYLFHFPGGIHPEGSTTDINHYETGKLLGRIPEVRKTYTVVGLMNEHQVALGETTFGGLDSLQSQPGAILDYGSLMRLALQRASTAREAIRIISELAATYGYASSGESFSVSDANEAWIMEIIGKGKYEKGAVWVAMKIPDGYVSGHANQARITHFAFQKANKWEDPQQNCFHAPDVISFAKNHGYYKGKDEDFSFSDVYNPVNFGGARFCDARIWAFFRRVSAEVRDNPYYTAYAKGDLLTSKRYPEGKNNPNAFCSNRLPLWVKPDSLLSLELVMDVMRDHYEGTPLDMRFDLGAGPYGSPYRWRPMEFEVDSALYLCERAIATQQTGYTFVAESRNWLPDPIGGIFWFGVDDADGCVFAPMYCSITRVPEAYAQRTGSMIEWSEKSAFWAFNLVNNFKYSRYNVIYPEIKAYQSALEEKFRKEVTAIDSKAASLLASNSADAIEALTDFSVSTGNQLQKDWMDFFHYLFMKYMDGNIKKSDGRKLLDNGNGKGIPPKPAQPGYGKEWERKMVENTGNQFRVK